MHSESCEDGLSPDLDCRVRKIECAILPHSAPVTMTDQVPNESRGRFPRLGLCLHFKKCFMFQNYTLHINIVHAMENI